MTFEKIHDLVKGVPYICKNNARILYNMIIDQKLTNILELGIAHGTATCYMAAALEEIGGGQITSVDLLEMKDHFKPSVEEQLAKVNLSKYVNVVRMETGYTWFLHDEIKNNTRKDICEPKYDLCIIDGPKNWTIDGCAFFCADKLLKKNGFMIFDDYDWTYGSADKSRDVTDGITHRKLSNAERDNPQIKEVFELLVKQHPSYSHFTLHKLEGWAIAQKSESAKKTYSVIYSESYKDVVVQTKFQIKRWLGFLKGRS